MPVWLFAVTVAGVAGFAIGIALEPRASLPADPIERTPSPLPLPSEWERAERRRYHERTGR